MIQLQEFYDNYLLNKTFVYTLRPHKKQETIEIKIKFFKENFPHLLGIQKIVPSYNQKKYRGKSGYDGIKKGLITLDKLKAFDKQNKKKIIPTIETRLTHFHLIEKLLLECSIVKFSSDKVDGFCDINSDFVLYLDEIGVRLHLGVIKDKINKESLYYPETFFVRNMKRDFDRYTKAPPQLYMNVVERKIIIDDSSK